MSNYQSNGCINYMTVVLVLVSKMQDQPVRVRTRKIVHFYNVLRELWLTLFFKKLVERRGPYLRHIFAIMALFESVYFYWQVFLAKLIIWITALIKDPCRKGFIECTPDLIGADLVINGPEWFCILRTFRSKSSLKNLLEGNKVCRERPDPPTDGSARLALRGQESHACNKD